ncbi:hypothetical protein COOONC_21509 [Cooperia oncophora]
MKDKTTPCKQAKLQNNASPSIIWEDYGEELSDEAFPAVLRNSNESPLLAGKHSNDGNDSELDREFVVSSRESTLHTRTEIADSQPIKEPHVEVADDKYEPEEVKVATKFGTRKGTRKRRQKKKKTTSKKVSYCSSRSTG